MAAFYIRNAEGYAEIRENILDFVLFLLLNKYSSLIQNILSFYTCLELYVIISYPPDYHSGFRIPKNRYRRETLIFTLSCLFWDK